MAAVKVNYGDIFWIDMQTAEIVGTEQKKDRPYVIMSTNVVNDLGQHYVGVPFSRQIHLACAHRIKIGVAEIIKDNGYTKPLYPVVALTDHVRVLDASRIMERVGRLSDSAIASVGVGLSYILGLDD